MFYFIFPTFVWIFGVFFILISGSSNKLPFRRIFVVPLVPWCSKHVPILPKGSSRSDSSSKDIIKSVGILNTLLGHSKLYLFNTNTWVWYLFKPWRKLQNVLRFDCSLLLHPHMRILFYFNESGRTGSTLMILIKQSMILFTFIFEFCILVAVWEFPIRSVVSI